MKPSEACIEFIKGFEGFRPTAYRCSAGVLTIGYGTTEFVEIGDTVTEEEACDLLRKDVQEAADAIDGLVDVELSQSQYDALTSWIYNCGRSAFQNSTLLKLLNSGHSPESVAAQLLRWDKSNGVVVSGLTRRRKAEYDMFLSPSGPKKR